MQWNSINWIMVPLNFAKIGVRAFPRYSRDFPRYSHEFPRQKKWKNSGEILVKCFKFRNSAQSVSTTYNIRKQLCHFTSSIFASMIAIHSSKGFGNEVLHRWGELCILTAPQVNNVRLQVRLHPPRAPTQGAKRIIEALVNGGLSGPMVWRDCLLH